MAVLPTTGLTGTPNADHITHHEEIHAFYNLTQVTVSNASIGDTITRINGTAGVTGLAWRQRHYVTNEQVMTHTHTTAGALTFTVLGRIRAVKINASANIAGINVTGMDLSGPSFADLHCLLVATANITVDLSGGATVIGAAPTTMTSGDQVPFRIERWNF